MGGELVVELHSENPDRFAPGSELLVGEDPDRSHPTTVRAARPHKGHLLVRFEAVDDRGQAERLRGLKIFTRAEGLPAPGDDAFWEHELAGLQVVDTRGRRLGSIARVISRPEQDLWEVDTPWGPVLLPAVRDIVSAVDRPQGVVTVDPPVGLFPDAGQAEGTDNAAGTS